MIPAFLLAALATQVGPPAPEAVVHEEGRAPMIGLAGPRADACLGIGRIAGGAEEQAVHEGPSEDTKVKDTLPGDTIVWLCEAADEWQGIVFADAEFQELGDCRVSRPAAEPVAYEGPCGWGWVKASSIELLTG